MRRLVAAALLALLAARPAAAQSAAQLGPNLITPDGWWATGGNGYLIWESGVDFALLPNAMTDWTNPHAYEDFALIPEGPSTLEQVLATTPGRSYQLAFGYGWATDNFADASFDVLWDGVSVLSVFGASGTGGTSSPFVALLAAAGSTARLTFTSTLLGSCTGGACDDWGARVDVSALSVREVVGVGPEGQLVNPEPATLALVGTGLAGLIAARRRERRRRA
jgi:hypothetical protein